MHVINVDFNECFLVETFQPMRAALTFQIGLNDYARVILTFAADLYVSRKRGLFVHATSQTRYQLRLDECPFVL